MLLPWSLSSSVFLLAVVLLPRMAYVQRDKKDYEISQDKKNIVLNQVLAV